MNIGIAVVALVCWLGTAGVGFVLADRWVAGPPVPAGAPGSTSGGTPGGERRLGRGPGIMLGAHIAPATTSLLAWGLHVMSGGPVLGWIAIGLLGAGVLFGAGLFALGRRRRRATGRRTPRPIVAHATLACATLVLAVLSIVV